MSLKNRPTEGSEKRSAGAWTPRPLAYPGIPGLDVQAEQGAGVKRPAREP